jgi:hypothetical protein
MRRLFARALLVGVFAAGSLAAVSASAFEGRYTAGTPDYEQSVVIRKAGDSYRGDASVATRGCVGDFQGTGRAKGDSLVLVGRENTYTCRLTLRRVGGSKLEVRENGCLTFHGAACEFSGSYERQAR